MRSFEGRVREAGADERARVSATLADAFATDPILQWLIPSRPGRRARLSRLFALELERYVLPAGRVLTTDDVRGASLELPPDAWMWPNTMPLSAAIGWVRVFGLGLSRATETQRSFERNHLQERHYYIRYVGVAARFRGEGLGTALLRPTLDRCDREGVPAYLEASSDRSAALYQRLGFIHLGEQLLPGGPAFWPMRRPPVAAQAAATRPA
jgi:ribosomal protein S18 acetylase RimI-like enzyme